MKPARFHPEAEVELAAEAKYYEERSPGLGVRFTGEIEVVVLAIAPFPRKPAYWRGRKSDDERKL